jgi:hypothetical protein
LKGVPPLALIVEISLSCPCILATIATRRIPQMSDV